RGVQSGIAVLGTLDAAMLIPLLMDYFMPSSFVQQSLNILGPAAVVLGGLLSTLYIIPDAIKLIKAGWLTFELFQAESVEDKLKCFTSYLDIDLESIIDKSQNGRLVSVKDADDSLVTADEKKAIRQQLSTRYGNDYTAEHFWTAVDAVSKAHQKRHCELRVALGQTGLALVQGLRDGSKTMKPDEAVDLLTHQLKRRLLRRSVRMIVSLLSLSSTILLLISTSHIAVLITTGIWLLSTLVNFYFTSTGWINAQKEETSSTGYLPMFISAVVFLATITAAILLTTTPVGYVGIALLSLLWIGMMGYTIYSIHMKKEKLDVFGRPL
ncbi:MAG TPA: hypothetical protein PLO43_02210, partial [Chlamydiales bacterium]|nr:hypothetical protein [Chlamydiales bacterium]